jgi:EmrB/QacA subfamily drug resistance transporter
MDRRDWGEKEMRMAVQEKITTRMEGMVLVATILASAMAFIDGSALNVALPAVQTSLGANGTQLLWIVNGYLLMLASLILIGGSLGDRLGRKRIYAIGIATFLAGSLGSGLAPTANVLIATRIIQGIGGALMIPGSLALINANYSDARRGQAIGTWSAVVTIVTVAGPLLGGLFAGAGLWRLVFLINVPLGLAALFILITRVPESSNPAAQPIDYPGAVAATLALAGLTYGFISAPSQGFGAPAVALSLGVGVIGAALFVWIESRSTHPMLPFSLFRSNVFSGTNLLTLFLYGGLSAMSFFMSLNLVQAQGYSESQAGLSFLPFALTLSGLSRFTGHWSDQHGFRLPLILGPSLVGIGFLVLSRVGITSGPAAYWTTFFPGIMVFALGMGITVAPLTTAVMGSVPRERSGTASGVNNAVSRTAGVLTIAILGSLALIVFENQLQTRVAGLDLPAPAAASLRANAGQLGNTPIPPGIPAQTMEVVRTAIRQAFAATFSAIMLVTACLAFAAAITAAVLVRGRT